MRQALDTLYRVTGAISGAFIVAILLLIAAKWGARTFGITFSIGSDYAGYAMAGASFMGFAYALNHGAHIRVTLGLNALGRFRRFGEVWCFALGSVISSWIAWEACNFMLKSAARGYAATAPHATPLWIPQVFMAVGAVILAICFIDNFVSLLVRGRTNIVEAELEDVQAEI